MEDKLKSLRRSWMPQYFILPVQSHPQTMTRFLITRSCRYTTRAIVSKLLPATGFTNPSSTHSLRSVGMRISWSSGNMPMYRKHGFRCTGKVLQSEQSTMDGLCIFRQSPSQALPIPEGTLVHETHTYAADSNFRYGSVNSSESNLGHPVAEPLSIA
ncbi:sacI homology domain-containing protein / WW domain-containing protein [Striga asiatica]|uniref:SacI homology domain-containing protein / WW domain-containing protein n=1 Tax=Striga asiatica TaxID=4170 RepID=A0A5A7R881_STRAF|nr:sacI homology domain-containing protein / WW domain-containing protein [Striga asiatica]